MTLAEIHRHPRFLELADQIENHSRAMAYLLEELSQTFPPPYGEVWAVQTTDHRPSLAPEQY